MISEGSCDTEDWSVMLKVVPSQEYNFNILKYIKTENSYFKLP